MTDAGTQPHAKDQLSVLNQPISLRHPFECHCSALSVFHYPGSSCSTSWPPGTRHSALILATAQFKCLGYTLQRGHGPSAFCSLYNSLGSALSVTQQPSQSLIIISPPGPCMAANSSIRDNSEHPADEILQFYRSLEWTTSTPPPLTVYLQPYLQDLLKRRSQTISKPPPSEEDHGRSLRHSSQTASSGPTPVSAECRAPRTPPGATSSRDLAAKGRLPSRPRAPKRARTRSRSAAPRKPSRRPSGRPSRKPSSSSPSRRSRRSRTTPATRSTAEIRPKPKRYPLAPPENPRPPASDTRTPLASSPSTVPSESSAVTNPPGALIDAFFKTTDTAAQRVYTACCTCASLRPLPSLDLRSYFALQVYSALDHTRTPAYFFLWHFSVTLMLLE